MPKIDLDATSTVATTTSSSEPYIPGEDSFTPPIEPLGDLIIEDATTSTSTDYTGVSVIFGFLILIIFVFTLLYRISHQRV